MALAKIERELAAKGEGCLGKAADDEPVFILRANDKTAPEVIEHWARKVEASYCDKHRLKEMPVAKLKEAKALAHQMRAWQELNGSKLPD